jgi:uncharacterized YccA/Bax inhibitor family protein
MSNPVLSVSKFAPATTTAPVMTIRGAIHKSLILSGLTLASAVIAFQQFPDPSFGVMIGASILAFIAALAASFNPSSAPITGPIYAVLEGLSLGMVSSVFEREFDGIVAQAVMLTFGTLFGMLGLYSSGVIRMTQRLGKVIFVATAGIAITYLLTPLFGLLGVKIPFVHDSGMLGIGFSVFVVVVAALNLIADFALIEEGANHGAPKYMEWYSAFALQVTLVWLYLEILSLLAKASDDD